MSTPPPCPQCHSTYTCKNGGRCVCPECAHEWTTRAAVAKA